MKNKALLPIILLAGLVLSGCGGGNKSSSSSQQSSETSSSETSQSESSQESSQESSEGSESSETSESSEESSSSEDPVVYGVSINNKEEMEAEWAVGGASRSLSLTLTPAANALVELANGNLVVESSDTKIATVSGLGVAAVKGGTATITVTYHGETDFVTLNIVGISTKYGVDHEGTAADPLTNEEALKVAKAKNYDGEDLHVGGKIASFYHAPGARTDGKVSWFLEPAEPGGEKFEIYLCLKDDGSALTDDDIWVGGYAIAHGSFTVYGSQYETSAATFVSCEGNKPAPRTTIEASFAEVLTAGAALADGADTYDYYQFDAFVTAKDGTNYFLTATKGEGLISGTSDEAHGSKSYYTNGFEIYNASADLQAILLKDAKVTVKTIVKNYHGTIENLLALTTEDVTVVTPGEPWVIEYTEVNVAAALTAAKALDDNAYSEGYYKVSGKVKAITGAWSSQYKNVNFTIVDALEDTETLTVFRWTCTEEEAAKLVSGVDVVFGGKLQNYVKNEKHTYELTSPVMFEIGEAPVVPPVEINYGTADSPLNIAGVKAELDKLTAGTTSEGEFYVKGFVSSNAEISTTKYGIIWLTDDDGSVEQAFEIYNGYGDQEYAANALVGKEIVVKGYGKIYGTTYELTSVKIEDVYHNPTIVEVTTATRDITSLTLNPSEAFELEQGASKAVSATKAPFASTGNIVWSVSPSEQGVSYNETTGKIEATGEAVEDDYTLTATVEGSEPAIAASVTFTVVEAGGGQGEQALAATLAKGTGSAYDDVKINGESAVKVGSSKNTGTATITLDQVAKSVSFYVVGWKGDTVTVNVSASNATLSSSSLSPASNNAIAGTETNFELEDVSEYLVTIELTDAQAGEVITLTGGKAEKCRFIIWNATYLAA